MNNEPEEKKEDQDKEFFEELYAEWMMEEARYERDNYM